MSGASASWYDLVLYLVVRYVGPTAAQAMSKFFALQWHSDGQAPYLVFDLPMDHEDAMIRDAQVWLSEHFSISAPITEVAKRRLERTNTSIDQISWSVGYGDAASFRRLFKRITGITPGDYRRKFSVPHFAQKHN